MENVAGLGVTGEHSRRFYHIFFMFSLRALFSFWRKPNSDMRISVFQRGASSSIIWLSLLLGQFSLKKEALVSGLSILKEESHTCCLGPFLFRTGGAVWIKRIILESHALLHLYGEPHAFRVYRSFQNYYFDAKTSSLRIQFFGCEIFPWIQWL